jgi:hypothetical protein
MAISLRCTAVLIALLAPFAAAHGQATSWKLEVRQVRLPAGNGDCAPIEVVARDASGHPPVTPDGKQVDWQDFDITLTQGAGPLKLTGNGRFLCATAPGATGVVTVKYPESTYLKGDGKGRTGKKLIPGVTASATLDVRSAGTALPTAVAATVPPSPTTSPAPAPVTSTVIAAPRTPISTTLPSLPTATGTTTPYQAPTTTAATGSASTAGAPLAPAPTEVGSKLPSTTEASTPTVTANIAPVNIGTPTYMTSSATAVAASISDVPALQPRSAAAIETDVSRTSTSPKGPFVVGLQVVPTPAGVYVRWDAVDGVKYTIRRESEQYVAGRDPFPTDPVPVSGSSWVDDFHIGADFSGVYFDHGYARRRYVVTATDTEGRTGTATSEFITVPEPEAIEGGVSTSEPRIETRQFLPDVTLPVVRGVAYTLTWKPVPMATSFLVKGSALPAEGLRVGGTSVTIDVEYGSGRWTVQPLFQAGDDFLAGLVTNLRTLEPGWSWRPTLGWQGIPGPGSPDAMVGLTVGIRSCLEGLSATTHCPPGTYRDSGPPQRVIFIRADQREGPWFVEPLEPTIGGTPADLNTGMYVPYYDWWATTPNPAGKARFWRVILVSDKGIGFESGTLMVSIPLAFKDPSGIWSVRYDCPSWVPQITVKLPNVPDATEAQVIARVLQKDLKGRDVAVDRVLGTFEPRGQEITQSLAGSYNCGTLKRPRDIDCIESFRVCLPKRGSVGWIGDPAADPISVCAADVKKTDLANIATSCN